LLVADGEIAITQAADLDAGWMLELLGIPVSATRRKCALVSLKVVRHAFTGYVAGQAVRPDDLDRSFRLLD
jgi:hypothetical protein